MEEIFLTVVSLSIYRLRSRWGLMPLFVFSGSVLMLATSPFVQGTQTVFLFGIPERISLVGVSLFAVSLVYYLESYAKTRAFVYSVLITRLTFIPFEVFSWAFFFEGVTDPSVDLLTQVVTRAIVIIGTGALPQISSLLLLVILLDLIHTLDKDQVTPLPLRLFIPMGLAELTDGIIYSIFFVGEEGKWDLLVVNAGSRLFATIVFGSILLFYLMGQEGPSITIRSSPFTILRMEKVKLEAELEKTIEELEIANVQLSRARDGISFLNELMTHDIANFSHAASGFLDQVLHNPKLDEETRKKFLDAVERNITKSIDLIRGTQSLSDVITTSGLELPVVSLTKAISVNIEAVKKVDVKKQISISSSGLELEAYAKTGTTIDVILNNLLGNAVKFSRNLGEKILSVSLEEFSDDSKYWLISVTDYCGGISDKEKKKVFEKFTRFHKNVQGSGLGLYIVQELVSALNGRIWVKDNIKDEEIAGCIFQFTLPKANPNK